MSKLTAAAAVAAVLVVSACQDPSAPARPSPTPESTSLVTGWTTLVAMGNHTCGWYVNRNYCWGRNSDGQVGDATFTGPRLYPTDVREPAGVVLGQLDGGSYHTCGLTSGGLAYCWGNNSFLQLGIGSNTASRYRPVAVVMPVGATFTTITAGQGNHTCALDQNGVPYCWGNNFNRQLGTIGTQNRPRPYPVRMPVGVTAFTEISGGANHTCALTAAGAAYCWGDNINGQLGAGANYNPRPYPYPVKMPVGVTFTSITAGRDHTCALATTGAAYCWGSDATGQIGLNRTDALNWPAPRAVRMPYGGVTFSQISAGHYHNCALGSDSEVYCWGWNLSGQLGVSDQNQRNRPTAVSGTATYTSVSAKYLHSCAITTGTEAQCWGVNTNGELGTGDQFNKLSPTLVALGP